MEFHTLIAESRRDQKDPPSEREPLERALSRFSGDRPPRTNAARTSKDVRCPHPGAELVVEASFPALGGPG